MGKHKSWVKPKCAMLGSVFVFSLIFSSLISANHVKSLTFSQDVNVAFSFNSALRLSLSDSLYIYNLVPGSTSDSNIIDVIVLTNNTTGYTLNATVGNNTPYNSRSLINPASNNATFDSIAYGSSLANLTTPSTWGYAYLDTTLNNNTNTTWSTYSGLPLHSDTTNIATLKSSYSPVTTATGDLIKFKIAAYAASSQPSGTYNNIINFTLIANPTPSYTVKYDANGGSGTMPDQTIYTGEATKLSSNFFVPPNGYTFAGWNTAANGSGTSYTDQQSVTNIAADGATLTLYAQWGIPLFDRVVAMSKGKQTLGDIRTEPITPTSTKTISSNSGVYEYDASVFGTSSDASNNYPIYYYRGILDSYGHTSSNGSAGLADAYPNYVKLDNNTCWRIVRTTGSGGVKMIYNGVWGSNTCAKSGNNASALSTYYNRGTPDNSSYNYGTRDFIVYVGYNYNSAYGYNHTENTSAVAISTLFNNETPSNMRTQIESWYASNMTAYTSILESSAGYCNDRSVYGDTQNPDGPFDFAIPYDEDYHFGPHVRVRGSNLKYNYDYINPSLNCPNATGYDLLTTSNGLTYPVALLTQDEATFAGFGKTNTFLRTGVSYWLLSPEFLSIYDVRMQAVHASGGLTDFNVDNTGSVRPVISLKAGTTAVSGTGTATDPWVVNAP